MIKMIRVRFGKPFLRAVYVLSGEGFVVNYGKIKSKIAIGC